MNLYQLPLAASSNRGKPLPESQRRIAAAHRMDGICPKDKGGKKTLLLSDGAPCYKGLCKQHKVLLRQCNHSKGVFSVWRYAKGRGHIRVHTGSLDAYWTLMKDGIPKSLSSHCAGKPNPKLWKYIKIQQWRWEMGLSKTRRQLAMLWKRRDFNSHPFWTQNPVRVNEPSEFSDFLGWSFWTWNMHAAMAKKTFSWNHGPVIGPAGFSWIFSWAL